MQAVVTAACQQEHTLRMRALHLRFIDDSKQPSVAAPAAAAAAEAGGGAEEDEEPPDTTPTAPQLPAEPDFVSPSTTQPAVTKKRGRQRSSGRTPVRTIEQVMQELQLPKTRCGRPSAAAHTTVCPS